MALEIERKFKVLSGEYKNLGDPIYCKQGYLNLNNNPLIRIRVINDKAYLTMKGKNKGISRLEFEYEIPLNDANHMLKQYCPLPLIEKYRYHIKIKNTIWEVDEFLGENLGLVIAEVELLNEKSNFYKPSWIGEEVSNQIKYFNSKLIENPYSKWI